MLTQKEIDIIIDTLKPYNPKRIGVFGSVARNEEKISSDIDILYNFNVPISLFVKYRLLEALKNKLYEKIDLVSEKAIHFEIKKYIFNDLKVIYGQ